MYLKYSRTGEINGQHNYSDKNKQENLNMESDTRKYNNEKIK